MVHSLLRLVRIARHKKKTLIQALCVATMLGAVYYATAPRNFESSAKLLIVQRTNDQLPTMGDQASSDNIMTTHQELVTSPIVVQAAIEQLLPEHRHRFPRPAAAGVDQDSRQKSIGADHAEDKHHRSPIPLAASGSRRGRGQRNHPVLLRFVDQTHHGSATDVIRVLTSERDQLQQSLAAKQLELQAFRQSKGRLAIKSDGKVVDPMIQRVVRLNDALMTAQEARLDSQATLATVEAAVRNSANLSQHLAAIEKVMGKEMLSSALGFSPQDVTMIHDQEKALIEVRTELDSIAPYYGPSHPALPN